MYYAAGRVPGGEETGVRKRGRGVQAAVAALAATGVIFAVERGRGAADGNEFPVGVDDNALQFSRPRSRSRSEATPSCGTSTAARPRTTWSRRTTSPGTRSGRSSRRPPLVGPVRYTFKAVGEYTYVCDLHRVQGMTGKVTVIAAGRNAGAHAEADQDRDPAARPATATPDHRVTRRRRRRGPEPTRLPRWCPS